MSTHEHKDEKEATFYYQKLCNQIRLIEKEYRKLNLSPDERIKQDLSSLKLEKERVKKNLAKKRERKKKSACRQFLRQQINQLRNRRDFDNFQKSIDIGSIEEGESISDSDDFVAVNSYHSNRSPSGNKKEFTKNLFKKDNRKFDFNDIFKIVGISSSGDNANYKENKEINEHPTDTSPLPNKDT